jgi:hypothetical protein
VFLVGVLGDPIEIFVLISVFLEFDWLYICD